MYKITGYLDDVYYSPEGNIVKDIKKQYKARFKITFLIKLFFMRLLYDWVEVEYE